MTFDKNLGHDGFNFMSLLKSLSIVRRARKLSTGHVWVSVNFCPILLLMLPPHIGNSGILIAGEIQVSLGTTDTSCFVANRLTYICFFKFFSKIFSFSLMALNHFLFFGNGPILVILLLNFCRLIGDFVPAGCRKVKPFSSFKPPIIIALT